MAVGGWWCLKIKLIAVSLRARIASRRVMMFSNKCAYCKRMCFIKVSKLYCHFLLCHVLPRPVRGDSPCGGCWGCSPQRCELDVASSRTLVSPTAMWSSCGSTKSCPCSTACARHRACGRNGVAVGDGWLHGADVVNDNRHLMKTDDVNS